MKKGRIKVTVVSKRKAFISSGILFLLIITLFFGIFDLKDVSGKNIDNTLVHTVSRGETLWSIAETYVCSNKDVRMFVYEIEQMNDIRANDFIMPGQCIIIPVDR